MDFLETFGLRMLSAGQSQLLVRWVEELPYLAHSEHGNLMAAYGKALVLTGESEHGIHALNQAESMIRLRNDPSHWSACWPTGQPHGGSWADTRTRWRMRSRRHNS